MRVILDANVLISYLLPSRRGEAIATIVESALRGEFTILLPEGLGEELTRAVVRKDFLRTRIRLDHVRALTAELTSVAEVLPSLDVAIPAATRDPKDDYLLAHALMAQADYLVTGDRDLLALREVGQVKIVAPADFVEILKAQTEGDR